MEEAMPEIYKELDELQTKLENHYHDMQDMEFTVQEGKLWFLQTRNGKRTGAAMVRIAMEMLHQGMIDEKTALMRCEPNKLDELLHPVFDKEELSRARVLTRGLPASPGCSYQEFILQSFFQSLCFLCKSYRSTSYQGYSSQQRNYGCSYRSLHIVYLLVIVINQLFSRRRFAKSS